MAEVKHWPASMRNRLSVSNFNQTTKPTIIRSNMSVGVDKIRNRYSSTIHHVSGSILLTRDQVIELDTFYISTLNGGVNRFWFPDQITETSSGDQILKEHRFLEPPSYTAVGGDWFKANLKMERFY